jgi:Xaa-Pro aminopeptidase
MICENAMSAVLEKLTKLRECMAKEGVDFYYVPSSDQHQDEYVPAIWQRRAWISEFTGSAGDVLVGKDQAYLWTDGRYFLQAEKQLDGASFTLMRQMQGAAAPIDQWLAEQGDGLVVGVDPRVVSVGQALRLQSALESRGGKLQPISENLVDAVRDASLSLPAAPVTVLDLKYTGLAAKAKISNIRTLLEAASADALAINTLDEIAWLLNLRGSDIAYNPVFISYLLVDAASVVLFVDETKLSFDVVVYLQSQGVQVAPYDAYADALSAQKGRVVLDPNTATLWMKDQCKNATVVVMRSPIVLQKACKNKVERDGMREAHRLDGIAEVRFLAWLEAHWVDGLTEVTAADKLEAFRRESDLCVGLSFNTICGFGSNGAIIHYAAQEQTAKTIDDSNMLLLDSGGQYLCGTTDITRTMHFGVPTADQKRHYTQVLKGHLALRNAVFPHGVGGAHLDTLARQFLWQDNLDYNHGTGHGVGSHLCVHEGPIAIRRGAMGDEPLLPGMIVSNEPGFYLTGKYGIRIENLLLITEHRGESASGHGPFYAFEDLVLIPYARKLIDLDLLDQHERNAVDAYHQRVYKALSADLDAATHEWLKEACAAL